jgi:hypothetical protein
LQAELCCPDTLRQPEERGATGRSRLQSEGFGETIGETGVDSPHEPPHREDPQVVEDREETLTAPALQIG